MDKLTTLYIVRHGETDGNVRDIMQGHTDLPLNEKGKEQAKELVEILKDIHFDEIISSDLSRAVQTAEAVALERKLTVKTTQALREKHYGSYEGKHSSIPQEELKHLFDKLKTLNDEERMKFKVYSDGESDLETVERFMRHLRELSLAYPGKSILIAAHGGVMRYLLVKLGWATYKQLPRYAIKNAGYIKLESDGVDFFVKDTFRIETD